MPHVEHPLCQKHILTPGDWYTKEASLLVQPSNKKAIAPPLSTRAKFIKQARAYGRFNDETHCMSLLYTRVDPNTPQTTALNQGEIQKVNDSSPSPIDKIIATNEGREDGQKTVEEKESVSGRSEAKSKPIPLTGKPLILRLVLILFFNRSARSMMVTKI